MQRELTVSMVSTYKQNDFSHVVNVPYIRLSGKWLQEIGFDIGNKYFVTKTDDGLLLKVKH